MNMLSERFKLIFLSFLLLLVLGFVALTAFNTFQAARSFQQQHAAIKNEDVMAIRPWMTIHLISHIYHIPEDYLYSSLNLTNSSRLRHATLYETANHKRQPVDQVIRMVQHAIWTYRREHHGSFIPHSALSLRTPMLGGTTY